jgi:protein-disulfide isomerase
VNGLRRSLWIAVALLAAVGITGTAWARYNARAAVPKVTAAQIEAGKSFGVKTAPIRIDEYSDFECPHCQEQYLNTLRPLIDDYVSSGKVYLVHHDFPLPMHPYAKIASYYADAAAAIGRFPQVEQALFVHQAQWAATGKIAPIVAAALSPAHAREVEALAHTPEVQAAVQRDIQKGQALGIDQTPTMYITHKGKRTPISGAVSYPVLRQYLNALLRE